MAKTRKGFDTALVFISLFGFLNRWNDSMGTTLEADAIDTGEKYLANHGWTVGKHKYLK